MDYCCADPRRRGIQFAALENGPRGGRAPEAAWKGSFYSNPNHPSLLVPKRYGIGYTLNFGNPMSWVVMTIVALLVVLPFIFLATSTHHLPAASR